jgi:hypothetical protein
MVERAIWRHSHQPAFFKRLLIPDRSGFGSQPVPLTARSAILASQCPITSPGSAGVQAQIQPDINSYR